MQFYTILEAVNRSLVTLLEEIDQLKLVAIKPVVSATKKATYPN